MSSTSTIDRASGYSSISSYEQKRRALYYPFAAIVGMEAAKRALMLLAVDPGLQGAIIATSAGSDATLLARSFAVMLAQQDSSSSDFEDDSSRVTNQSQAIFPLIDLPLNVTADRLLGGIDLERTIATGAKHHAGGLLAEANGGLLFASDINLLDANLTDHIAAAMDAGVVRLEREGVSATYPSRFRFVGTFAAEEGEVSPHLKDRVGIIVESAAEYSTEEITEAVSRALRFEQDPRAFVEEFAFETAALMSAIKDARARLGEINVTSKDVRRIAEAAISLCVEGNRADIFAIKAARANAALAGRDAITDDDIIVAIQLVLLPRATRIPAPEDRKEEANEPSISANEESAGDNDLEPDDDIESSNAGAGDAGVDDARERTNKSVEELIIEAMDSPAPDDAFTLRRSKAARATSGKRSQVSDHARGRYAGSDSRRKNNARLALDATLRAAAPHQIARRDKPNALRSFNAKDKTIRITKDKTVRITKDDLRFKKFKRRSGILFIFAVDASGSMAVNRMAQAKGALTRLLQQAYLHRDKVAMISFRRSTAETILAPTRSVELAKRIVDALPTGGATPIAAALVEALSLSRLARLQGTTQAALLLFTDGRANVGLLAERARESLSNAESISEELRRIGGALATDSIATVVIDTRPRFVSMGEARTLADLIGASYLYLPRADSTAICEAVSTVSEAMRHQG
jgi:magnesium chelatase subunit D